MSRPYAAKLQELLQASYNLPNAVCDLGRIELGPSELEEVTRRIYEHDKGGIDAKAHYLLAASGFNAEQVLSEIAKIKLPSVEANRPDKIGSKALERTSSNHPHLLGLVQYSPERNSFRGKVRTLASSVDPIVKQNSREFDDFVNQQLKVDWTTRKREILEFLEASPTSDLSGKPSKGVKTERSLLKKRPGAHILGSPSTEPTTFTPLMRMYGEVTSANCDNNLQLPDIVKKFANVAVSIGTTQSGVSQGYISDSWQALEMRDSLCFLEKQYRDYIDSEISSHRQDAKLGGIPSSFSKIKAYVALKYLHHEKWDVKLTLINKTPIWAYLYYMVRAGHFQEALQLVLERKDIFETMGSSFAVYFKAWVDSPSHNLSPHYKEMVNAEYLQLFRPSSLSQADPYKQALYKIIGRCDLSKRTLPKVAITTEDWLWLQLRLCEPSSQYTIEDLRAYILDIGPAHLASDPLKYFTILIMLGLYCDALKFLQNHDEAHAVHFAIALVSQGALKQQDLESCDFNSLVGRYTRHFRQAMPSLAVDYLMHIALPQTPESFASARGALQELVLETRRFSELIGDVKTFTNQSIAGSIERRMELVGLHERREYLHSIAKEAAAKADDDGKTVDAILLYRLAEEPECVLKLVNTQLGMLLSGVPLGQPVDPTLSPSFDILQLARNVMRIDGDSLSHSEAKDTCMILLAIAECFDLLAAQEYQSCLERISQTGLLVLSPEPAVDQARELAQRFRGYDESISRNIPYVLLMAMTSIIQITEELRSSETSVAGRLLDQYRGRANNCMVYAGLIQFRMPREVYARLTQLEAKLA